MKRSNLFFSYLLILLLLNACNPVCDDTINKSVPYLLICNDTSNLITEVTQTYKEKNVTTYKNDDGNDTIFLTVALDKPNTIITIKREKSTERIDYTLMVKKTFEPESDCEDNNLVYTSESLKINQTTCTNLTITYIDRRVWYLPYLGSKFWQLTIE